MKKEINIKEAMTAYEKLHLIRTASWCRDAVQRAVDTEQAVSEFNAAAANLTEAITESEGRASARTLSAEAVCRCLYQIELKLAISKKAMEGITVTADVNAQSFPGAYHGTPESTHFAARYSHGYWRVTAIHRDRCGTKKGSVNLTDEAKAAIIARAQEVH